MQNICNVYTIQIYIIIYLQIFTCLARKLPENIHTERIKYIYIFHKSYEGANTKELRETKKNDSKLFAV